MKKVGELLLKRLELAREEQKLAAAVKTEENLPPTAKSRPSQFKLGGVVVNTRTLSSTLEEMEPLGKYLPAKSEERLLWRYELHAKNTQFDVEWGPNEDTLLLRAIYECGWGNWDLIREYDPLLREKIFTGGDKKPLVKHAQTRAEYLINAIRKHLAVEEGKSSKGRKKKDPPSKKTKKPEETNPLATATPATAKKKKPTSKKSGPMHFTASAPTTSIQILGELDPIVFNECKEKMRPVKKALKSLDNPDPSLSEKEQVKSTRSCLIQIGDQIQECLRVYQEPELKNWKTHLWTFVSKFTEYDAVKLYRLYKRARGNTTTKSGGDGKKEKSKKRSRGDKSPERHHHRDKKEKKDRRERDESPATTSRDYHHSNKESYHHRDYHGNNEQSRDRSHHHHGDYSSNIKKERQDYNKEHHPLHGSYAYYQQQQQQQLKQPSVHIIVNGPLTLNAAPPPHYYRHAPSTSTLGREYHHHGNSSSAPQPSSSREYGRSGDPRSTTTGGNHSNQQQGSSYERKYRVPPPAPSWSSTADTQKRWQQSSPSFNTSPLIGNQQPHSNAQQQQQQSRTYK